MICKWCGAEMARNDPKCRRCGKERPALSDCGGFYDLVPQAAPRPAAPVRAPQKKGSPFAPLCLLLAIALAVSVFFCVKLSGQKREFAEEVAELEAQLEEKKPAGSLSDLLPGKDDGETEPEATAETEETEPEEEEKDEKKSGKE